MLAIGAERSRRLAGFTLATLARAPLGLKAIDFLGHMRADPRLRTRVGMLELAGPIALGALIDPAGQALPSFGRFGVGMIEVGPVAEQANGVVPEWRVDPDARTVSDTGGGIVVGVEEVARNLERAAACKVPVCVRIAPQEPAAVRRIVAKLQDRAALFVVSPENVRDALGAKPVLSDEVPHPEAAGVRTNGGAERVRELRAALPENAIVVAGGVTLPHDARLLLAAGANIAVVDAGLVCSGPGLIKRCNEALLSTQPPPEEPEPFTLDAARSAWFWAVLMGVGMFAGGVLATIIASTRVVLPYDESLCGLTRAQMVSLNPRLLPFMAHDRISLAGAMLSIGIFYTALGWFGIRRGAHWAHVAVIVSAIVGFLSFFSFLGFGYFDPFHAFVTAIITQFTLLCMVMQPSAARPPVAEWTESAAWRRGQWGQLLFIMLGVGLTGAGIVITIVGCTEVFVATDLAFMRTTAAQLRLSYERLVPLVAHDRASLGGMLIANGVTVWLSAQWGFRAGTRWLWLALAWGGNLAFALALGVHFVVGYGSWLHLTPAFAGWLLWNLALGLTKEWLATTDGTYGTYGTYGTTFRTNREGDEREPAAEALLDA
jgi:dihydroorotate dehydrogenase